jgi:hypothetical protein
MILSNTKREDKVSVHFPIVHPARPRNRPDYWNSSNGESVRLSLAIRFGNQSHSARVNLPSLVQAHREKQPAARRPEGLPAIDGVV